MKPEINRENLMNLLNTLNNELTQYLNLFKYEIIAKDQPEKLGFWKAKHMDSVKHNGIVPGVIGNKEVNVCVWHDSNRDTQLSAKRILNILQLKNAFEVELQQAKTKDPLQFNDVQIDAIKLGVQSAIEENHRLNSSYNKKHSSFAGFRELGHSWISSLFQKSLFQSRADKTLRKCKGHIDIYINKFKDLRVLSASPRA